MSNQRREGSIDRDQADLEARVGKLESGLADTRHPYTFSNGWRNHGGGIAPHGNKGGFYKDINGTVHLEGVLDKNGGSWAVETILTLPIGYRPPNTRLFSPPVSPPALSRVDISSDGVVRLEAGGAASPVNYLSLDGISFKAEL